MPGRLGFEGDEAPPDIKSQYVGKRVPDKYRKPGAANPVKYTWGAQTSQPTKDSDEEQNLGSIVVRESVGGDSPSTSGSK
jgi:hypothetical protein